MVHIENTSSLSLVGENKKVTVWCNNAGVKLVNISNLKIQNLRLIGCGASFVLHNYPKTAALVIFNGCELTLFSVTIMKGVGAGIMVKNVRGLTSITHLTVTDTVSYSNQTEGNQIAYSERSGSNDHALVLKDSNFIRNPCPVGSEDPNISIFSTTGLTVYIAKSLANVTISRSSFKENCRNLALIFTNITNILNMSVKISDTHIKHGRALKGGGLYIFITKEFPKAENELVQIQDCCHNSSATVLENVIFSGNTAQVLGAALYIQLKASPKRDLVVHNISLINCSFLNNSLLTEKKGGIAIHSNFFDISDYLFQFNPQYKIILSNCFFNHHYVQSTSGTNWENSGGNSVLFINTNNYFEFHNVTITKSSANAITAINSNLIFRGHVTLSFNKGSKGGGLYLCQDTTMYFQPNTTLDIFNNTVKHTGGGMFVESRCVATEPKCFFQISQDIVDESVLDTVRVNMYNNMANYGGSNLYGGDIDYCYTIDRPDWNISPFNNFYLFNTIFNITHAQSDDSSVTSRPRQVCFCINNGSDYDCNKAVKSILIYPGEKRSIMMVLVGQKNGTIPGVVHTSPLDRTMKESFRGGVQNVGKRCSNVTYTFFSNSSNSSKSCRPKVNFTIAVQQSGDHSDDEKPTRYIRKKTLVVTLKECPIGFTLNLETNSMTYYTCATCILNYPDLECKFQESVELDRMHIIRKTLGNTWIGFEYNDSNASSDPSTIKHNFNCPLDYCVQERVVLNLCQNLYRNSTICNSHRDGVACGACQKGYSALLGSSECGKCSNYYLLLLPAFALAGIVLVAALTLLNLTVSKGTLSGLIFYANVVEYNSAFVLPRYHQTSAYKCTFPTPILKVFIAWINLDLGIPTCFYDGMDGYAEAWLEFAFPIYIWSIAVIIIVLSNKLQCVANIAGKNAVKVLATLVLLSYTKFSRAVISTFSYTDIHSLLPNGSNKTVERVWLIDGNLTYFGLKHAVLFFFALFCGLACLPFTLVTLLFIKPLQRFSHTRLLGWLEKLKPFLDAYTGPYTSNARFWPGLLLLARICLSISGGLNTLSSKGVIQSATALVIITLLAVAVLTRPGLYTSRLLDALECFFLLNLALLLLGTTFYSSQKAVYDSTVGLAFFVFILIVLYHLKLKLERYAAPLRCAGRLREICGGLVNRLRARNDRGARFMNNFPPFTEYNQEREPLLSDGTD